MNLVVFALLLLVTATSHAQWVKTETHDDLHNKNKVKFVLAAKESGGGIGVVCSDGKLEDAWLMTDKIADSTTEGSVDVEYRRDNEGKPHSMRLPVSEDFHGVLLERRNTFGGPHYDLGFQSLLYGPARIGSGFGKNRKENNWARHLIVGISAYADSDAVYTFDVPDPSEIREACGIH